MAAVYDRRMSAAMITVADETVIWRYMRLGPFIEMIMTQGLYQTRVSEFEDKLEGAYGFRNCNLSDEVIAYLDPPRIRTARISFDNPRSSGITLEPVRIEDVIRQARRHTCVTCWYAHEGLESYAMWRVYGSDSFAVAVESTVGALRAAFGILESVRIGSVEYAPLPSRIDNVHELFFHKRKEYHSEREVRSVQVFPQSIGAVHVQAMGGALLDAILEGVIVAPGMRDTMINSLRMMISATFQANGLHFEPSRVRKSVLDSDLLA